LNERILFISNKKNDDVPHFQLLIKLNNV
jgi:hypothetical protein